MLAPDRRAFERGGSVGCRPNPSSMRPGRVGRAPAPPGCSGPDRATPSRFEVSTIWDKPGPLTATEWERVRLHPYHSERILARSPALAPIGRVASMHHEHQDGSGYYRQAAGREIPFGAGARCRRRIPYQDRAAAPPAALAVEQAAAELQEEAKAGRLDPDAVAGVLAVAGQGRATRRTWPGGLSDREVEVLRLLAAGCSVPQIARPSRHRGQDCGPPRTARLHQARHLHAGGGRSLRHGARPHHAARCARPAMIHGPDAAP